MANQTGLKLIGFLLGSVTAAVMLVAIVLVQDSLATPQSNSGDDTTAYAVPVTTR
jgi:hypothetical protein